MMEYRIVPSRHAFQVVETSPDGEDKVLRTFMTEAVARSWLEDYLRQRAGIEPDKDPG